MAAAAGVAPPAMDGGGPASSSASLAPLPAAAVEAVAAEWMLEFACSCLCRHFAEQSGAEFQRWRNVAQALINGLSQIPPHQKKTVYICQLLIRISEGKSLGLQFEKHQRISPLESALSFWTLLEKEEIKLEKLHEDIRRLIQIQIVAVHMENRYFKEAAEVLERLFTDSESDKPLRVKLATIIKTKDPYVPLLQNFSYSILISKIKSYVELFMKENETNFLTQEATKQVASKGLEATAWQNRPLEVNENEKSDLETKQRLPKEAVAAPNLTRVQEAFAQWSQAHGATPGDVCARLKAVLSDPCRSLPTQQILWFCISPPAIRKAKLRGLMKEEQCITSQSSGDRIKPKLRRCLEQKPKESRVLQNLNNLQNVEENGVSLPCGRKRQRWTYQEDLELKSGVREFGAGNWTKILVHGNFNNRTSVMLKDRWRTLSRIEQG